MFLSFKTQKERRAYGGSCFIELQYCPMPVGTAPARLVNVSAISHWELSSLYVHDGEMNAFYHAYKDIFGHALQSNLREGALDMWGINYYDPEKTARILGALAEREPPDFAVLAEWLSAAAAQNGFYVMGV